MRRLRTGRPRASLRVSSAKGLPSGHRRAPKQPVHDTDRVAQKQRRGFPGPELSQKATRPGEHPREGGELEQQPIDAEQAWRQVAEEEEEGVEALPGNVDEESVKKHLFDKTALHRVALS